MRVTLIDHMGNDISCVNAARVSFGKKSNWEVKDDDSYDLNEKDQKLIKYLAKHKHLSPFGHCFASFHIKAPIFVRAQLVKHEYLRMNETSRRYVDSVPEFFTPTVWRGRPVDKKQGSSGIVEGFEIDWQPSIDAYEELLERGVAPEQARMVLPQSMYTEWYWSGSLDAFANMCNLRCKPDTQEETRLIADQVSVIMSELYPHSWEALTNVA